MKSFHKTWLAMLIVAMLAQHARAVPEQQTPAQTQTKQPNIIILATGGTIAGAAGTGTQAGYQSGAVTIDAMITAVPGSPRSGKHQRRADIERRIAGHEFRYPAQTGQTH